MSPKHQYILNISLSLSHKHFKHRIVITELIGFPPHLLKIPRTSKLAKQYSLLYSLSWGMASLPTELLKPETGCQPSLFILLCLAKQSSSPIVSTSLNISHFISIAFISIALVQTPSLQPVYCNSLSSCLSSCSLTFLKFICHTGDRIVCLGHMSSHAHNMHIIKSLLLSQGLQGFPWVGFSSIIYCIPCSLSSTLQVQT